MHYWTMCPAGQEFIEGSTCHTIMTKGGSAGQEMPRPRRASIPLNGETYNVIVLTDFIKDAEGSLIVELEEEDDLPSVADRVLTHLTGNVTNCVQLSVQLATQLDILLVPPNLITPTETSK